MHVTLMKEFNIDFWCCLFVHLIVRGQGKVRVKGMHRYANLQQSLFLKTFARTYINILSYEKNRDDFPTAISFPEGRQSNN